MSTDLYIQRVVDLQGLPEDKQLLQWVEAALATVLNPLS